MRNNKAFTLVEIMVVIAIMAIIGFGAVNIAQKVVESTKADKTEAIIRTLVGILEEYQLDTGGFPASGIQNLYFALENNPKTRPLLEGLPQDCVKRLNYDWDGESGPLLPFEAVVIYDGWYASDDHSKDIDLSETDNRSAIDGNGENEPMLYINRGNGNFPIIRSAGKDRTFNTADDIISSEL